MQQSTSIAIGPDRLAAQPPLNADPGRTYDKRRVFLVGPGGTRQLFSMSQTHDGSVYCSSPDFATAIWTTVEPTPGGFTVDGTASIGGGKISLHASGMTAIRNHSQSTHTLVVKGNKLKDLDSVGARHLITVFPRQPYHIPASPAFNRASDYGMQTVEDLEPLVIVFFAVPRLALEIDFRFSLETDQMTRVPDDGLGMGWFALRYHHIVWLAYRTSNMERWPKHSYYWYSDGFWLPIVIGMPGEALRMELRAPRYALKDSKLLIDCSSGEATRNNLDDLELC